MAELIANAAVCPICKGRGTVRDGVGNGESVRIHTCLRCYGKGMMMTTPANKTRDGE